MAGVAMTGAGGAATADGVALGSGMVTAAGRSTVMSTAAAGCRAGADTGSATAVADLIGTVAAAGRSGPLSSRLGGDNCDRAPPRAPGAPAPSSLAPADPRAAAGAGAAPV
jgi:hypothetical protein